MITFTMPNIGLLSKVALVKKWGDLSGLQCGLFTNPLTVTDTLNYAALTQPSFPGYSSKVLAGGTLVGDNVSTLASWTSNPVTFTCTAASAPQTMWGTYVLATAYTGADLLVVANLPGGPQVISQNGDSITTQLTLTDQRAPGQP